MAKRRLVYVRVKSRPDSTTILKYGYKSTEEWNASDIETILGITGLQEDPGIYGAIFGINDPKPHRAKKKYSGAKTFSTYCSYDNVKKARKDGWSISNANYINIIDTQFAVAKCISLTAPNGNAFKYAWRMPKTFANKVKAGGLTALGIENLTTANAKEAAAGVNNFKPAIATKQNTDGSIWRTFCDPTKEPKGWNVTTPEWYSV